jgi:hypothetical protein
MGSWTELLLLLVIRAGAVTRGGRAWSANRSRKRGVTWSYPEVPGASTRHRPVRTDPDATSWSPLIPADRQTPACRWSPELTARGEGDETRISNQGPDRMRQCPTGAGPVVGRPPGRSPRA